MFNMSSAGKFISRYAKFIFTRNKILKSIKKKKKGKKKNQGGGGGGGYVVQEGMQAGFSM